MSIATAELADTPTNNFGNPKLSSELAVSYPDYMNRQRALAMNVPADDPLWRNIEAAKQELNVLGKSMIDARIAALVAIVAVVARWQEKLAEYLKVYPAIKTPRELTMRDAVDALVEYTIGPDVEATRMSIVRRTVEYAVKEGHTGGTLAKAIRESGGVESFYRKRVAKKQERPKPSATRTAAHIATATAQVEASRAGRRSPLSQSEVIRTERVSAPVKMLPAATTIPLATAATTTAQISPSNDETDDGLDESERAEIARRAAARAARDPQADRAAEEMLKILRKAFHPTTPENEAIIAFNTARRKIAEQDADLLSVFYQLLVFDEYMSSEDWMRRFRVVIKDPEGDVLYDNTFNSEYDDGGHIDMERWCGDNSKSLLGEEMDGGHACDRLRELGYCCKVTDY